jgi:hypothetical protein
MYAGIALGLVATELASRRGRDGNPRVVAMLGAAGACLALFAAGAAMDRDDYFFLGATSYAIFGLALGAVLSELRRRGARDSGVRFGALALAAAWTASISLGYASPALAGGALATALLGACTASFHAAPEPRRARPALALTLATAGLVVAVWAHARRTHPYHDLPAQQLTHRLDAVLPGARFLRTSENTYALVADLDRAVTATGGRRYAILTDFPCWWVKARERNPLSCDWPQSTELARLELAHRVIGDLERMRGRGRVIVQKVYTFPVARGFLPIADDDPWYFAARYVRGAFRKVGETEWFEIYE